MKSKLSLPGTWSLWFLILALGLAVAGCSSPEERAQAHYESGKTLLAAKEYAKAGLEFRNALKYNEKLAGAWFDLATVEEQAQNWPAVIDSLQMVVELDTENFEARIKLAKMQLASGKLDQALKNINAANVLKKENTDTFALRAAILFRLNDREGARVDAEHALALNPDNPDALAVLAVDQMASQNMTAALRFIDRGLVKDTNNLGLLMFKLKILEESHDDVRFEAVLRQIIAAYPDVKQIRQALLSFLASRNRIADVEAEMRAMLAANPDDTTMALDLVRVVGTLKGTAAAQTELQTMIVAHPSVVDFGLALAQIDFAEKRTDLAVKAVEAIIAKGNRKEDIRRAQLLLANMRIQMGQIEEVKSLISGILADDAKNAEALTLRASLSLDAGDIESAVTDLREALNQQPKSIPVMVLLGRAHERQGAVDLANVRLAEALKASNYNPQIALDYVAFLGRRGENEQIETVLNEAVSRNSGDTRLLTALAQVRLGKQDWMGAQAVVEALKKSGDRSGVSEQITGTLLLGQKKYDESIAALKDAYTSSAQATRPMYSLFLAYLRAGKISEAETFVQSILTANEKNADALVLLGSLRGLQKKSKEAEAAYNQAIERQPANAIGYVALAQLHFTQKQTAAAEAVLRRGYSNAPGELSISLALSTLLEARNDIEGAIAIYEEQLRRTPDVLIVINNLASLLTDSRSDAASLERAHQLAQRLDALDVPQFKDTVGWVAYRRGDFAKALLNLEVASKKLPNVALIKYHLAMTHAALKRVADAKEQFSKADALTKDGDPLKEKIRVAVAGLTAEN